MNGELGICWTAIRDPLDAELDRLRAENAELKAQADRLRRLISELIGELLEQGTRNADPR